MDKVMTRTAAAVCCLLFHYMQSRFPDDRKKRGRVCGCSGFLAPRAAIKPLLLCCRGGKCEIEETRWPIAKYV